MDYSKLAPSLAMAYEEYAEGREALADHVQEDQMPGFVAPRDFAKPARVVVTLECSPDADFSDLEGATGIEINAGGERVRTAIVPLDDLPALTRHPGIERVAPAQKVHPLMDAAPEKVGLPAFRTKTKLTGKGVIVGVVDSGIDSRHPAFAGRILRIWDQDARGGRGVPEGRYGIEHTGADLVKSKDDEGHGTHVAGIAAGSDSKFQGVAPEAEFVVVKTNMTNVGIIDGIQYVFRLAKELGKPAVVNLSLGGHSDPHDGTDAVSKAIDDESGPGRIVCCAAGNEGEDNIHAQLAPEPGETLRVPCLHTPDREGAVQELWFNGWYDGRDEVEVAVAASNGLTTSFQGVLPNGPQGNPNKVYRLGDWRVQIGTPGPDSRNRDHQITVRLRPPANARGSRTWTLLVRGKKADRQTTRVDVWISLGDGSFSGPHARSAMTIGYPGTATRAITVAAYTTKTRWKDIDGTRREASWLKPDDIAPFSSLGPRRDGKAKPDLTAPGAMIVSAQSRDSENERLWIVDRSHVAMQGTSMACPFAAGVVALLLSKDKTLDPGKVLSKIAYATRNGQQPDADTWGRGLIDLAKT